MRNFETGATRDSDDSKPEPWGFNSALVDKRFAEYMQSHQTQADGNKRASDNWKKGMPVEVYKHSLSRHNEDLRLILEGHPEEATEQDIETVLCAIRFNVNGMLHELVKQRVQEGADTAAHERLACIRATRDAMHNKHNKKSTVVNPDVGL
jgi:hypothetical protein